MRNIEIKNLFSQQALSKSSDITDGLEYTFELFNEADVIGDYGCWVHYDDLFGVHQQHAYMDIDTTIGRFVVYFQYNASENMNEQGIYRIKVTKIDSSKTYDDYLLGDEYENSGIYNPDWDINN